jgi:hypothetical protein
MLGRLDLKFFMSPSVNSELALYCYRLILGTFGIRLVYKGRLTTLKLCDVAVATSFELYLASDFSILYFLNLSIDLLFAYFSQLRR